MIGSVRRRRTLALTIFALTAGLIAAACARPPSPAGWAGARAIKVDGQGIVLVSNKGHLHALLGQTTADISSNERWQFPPKDRSLYPLSDEAQQRIAGFIDAFGSVDDAGKAHLKKLLADVRLSGPNAGAFKDAVSQSAASPADRSKTNDAVDAAITAEKNALGKIQAFYGDLGISSDQKTVFAASFKGMVFALDASTGNTRWVRDAGDPVVGGIAVDDDTIYFGTKGKHLFATDAATGNPKWQFDTKGEVWATPTIDGDTIYVTSVASRDGRMYALDKTGRQKWMFSTGAGMASRPVVAGGVVYAGAFDNKLYAINASDGSMLWSAKADNWFWATPIVEGGVVYAASLDGKVYAVDAKTGAARWQFDAGSPVRSAPLMLGGALIVAARNGRVYKLDPASGQATAGPAALGVGTTVLADVASDGASTIYVVPTSAVLYTLTDQLEVGSVPLQ